MRDVQHGRHQDTVYTSLCSLDFPFIYTWSNFKFGFDQKIHAVIFGQEWVIMIILITQFKVMIHFMRILFPHLSRCLRRFTLENNLLVEQKNVFDDMEFLREGI